MLTAALLKIFENAPVELKHLPKARAEEIGGSLLTADAASAERHDRMLLIERRELGYGSRELTKVIDADRHSAFERAEFHFVVVAGIEEREGAALIEPALQFAGRHTRGRSPGRIDPLDTKRNDLFFDPHQHPRKRLLEALAHFGLEPLKPRHRPHHLQQRVDCGERSSHEEIDPLRAEQDRALEPTLLAGLHERGTQRLEPIQRRETVGRNIGDHRGVTPAPQPACQPGDPT